MERKRKGNKFTRFVKVVVRKFLSRFNMLILLTLAQITGIVFLCIFAVTTKYGYHLFFLFFIIDLIVEIFVVNSNSTSQYKLAWTIVILFLPIGAGVLFWLIFSNKRTTRGKKRVRDSYLNIISEHNQGENFRKQLEKADKRASLTSNLIFKNSKSAVYKDSQVTYYPLGDYAWPDILNELKKAKKFIFLEYFIIAEGEFYNSILEILKQKVKEGVEVRFMYDDFGCLTKVNVGYFKYLRSLGFKVHVFNRIHVILNVKTNNRDHRKFLIIDGVTGFTGGINLADEYVNKEHHFGEKLWKDNCMKIQGPAVYGMTSLFLSNWDNCTKTVDDFDKYSYLYNGYLLDKIEPSGFVQPFGDIPYDFTSVGEKVYSSLISRSKNYVYICSPYVILSDTLTNAIIDAARSGVDVRIVIPGVPDKKLAYQLTLKNCLNLLNNGVKVYKYNDTFIHDKVVLSDDNYGICGTINFDMRSLYLHLENSVFMYKCKCLKDIKNDFNDMFKNSTQIFNKDLETRNIFKIIFRAIIEVFAPMF